MPMLNLLQSRLLNTPLLVTEARVLEIISALDGRIDISVHDLHLAGSSAPAPAPASAPIRTSAYPPTTAVIPIHGTLVHRGSMSTPSGGLLSYSSIEHQLRSALSDTDIQSIVLDIDSPGGEVSGAFDLAELIYAHRSTKPITAIINDLGTSAAYLLASAASSISATVTAQIGSIGVIMVHADKSEANSKAGVKYTTIYAGQHKADFSPNSPLSESALAEAQARVNEVYSLFLSRVSKYTGIDTSALRKTEARVYGADAALSLGLIHSIVTKHEYTESLYTNKGETMKTLTQTQAQTPATEPALATDPAPALETPPTPTPTHADPATLDPAAITAAVELERTRCLEILEACALGNALNLAYDLICDGSTPDLARKMVLSLGAAASDSAQISSKISAFSSTTDNPIVAEAKRRASA